MELLGRSIRLFVVALGIAALEVAPVAAMMTTQSTAFLPLAPVMITSYRTSGGGIDLDFVEVYNGSERPLDLASWTLTDVTNGRTMAIAPSAGLLAPARHVVMAAPAIVDHASYQLSGWTTSIVSPKPIITLRLERSGYRPSDVVIASKSIDSWMMRAYNTSSYSTSTLEAAYRTLWDDGLYATPAEPEGLEVSEIYAYASDCDLFVDDARCHDYLELHNASNHEIDLSDIVLRTDSNSSSRTSSNTFTLDVVLAPDEYLLINETDEGQPISLTNSGGHVWLEDMWAVGPPFEHLVVEWPSVPSGYQGYAYATDAGDARWTTDPTPGFANHVVSPVVAVAECPAGKYRNPDTGRCRTIEEAVSELAACEEGYERNPLTNRCRKLATAASTSLTPCAEGQERNPATNRCRSIASAVAELMPCDEGYERNPATNRCRKMQASEVPEAPFAVEPVASDVPVWQWWIGGAILAGLAGYGAWEWRHEIGAIWSRLRKK